MKTLIINEKKMLFGLITQRSGVRITLPLPELGAIIMMNPENKKFTRDRTALDILINQTRNLTGW